MNSIFFSVIIPLYNKEKYIKKTLDSVLNQTFTDFEIIIVDDGSKDKSCKIVESISDPRIRLIRQKNGGPSKARNRGIKEAKGQFIAFLDADDEWLPEKLEKQYELHSESPEVVWSCSGYKVVGGMREKTVSFGKTDILPDAIDAIVDGLSIWTSTVIIKTEIFENKGLYFSEDIKRSEDIEVWYKMACLYPKLGYIGSQLAIYNVKIEGSLTSTSAINEDFSTLTLEKRIKNEIDKIDENRRFKIQEKVRLLIKGWIIGFWKDKNNFHQYVDDFEPFMDNKTLKLMSLSSFLPKKIKIIILRIFN